MKLCYKLCKYKVHRLLPAALAITASKNPKCLLDGELRLLPVSRMSNSQTITSHTCGVACIPALAS